MAGMRLQIIGCHSATPRLLARPSAQVLEIGNSPVLIDCGEGTQMELRRLRLKFTRIEHIFISHLHGDHFFGLPGLISTFRLLGRERPLHIYGPKGIKEAITLLLKLGESWINYPLHFHELEQGTSDTLLEAKGFTVKTFPLKHRVPTQGFLFRELPGLRKLKPEVAESHGISRAYYLKIKQGADAIAADGRTIPNAVLTEPPAATGSYAYCSDTAFDPELPGHIRGVHTLYHEATFLHTEAALAAKTGHSTALEAGKIARAAEVNRLILGHFSSRYNSLDSFRKEAQQEFLNTELAADGKVFDWAEL
ncbi:RNAse Z [Robiginitalea myxolifaciens]|uniref:Ribonuclease Z n=1 Tax=Robiginitalea myxolifaciens TaxID=400055 RepID=A0A1I6H414_9FLAO|nr:ribonuclease Z [Robiginitalea myxolifaciens]SFR49149.1 RNAse Z [Robiginitalea myxolifaciens]